MINQKLVELALSVSNLQVAEITKSESAVDAQAKLYDAILQSMDDETMHAYMMAKY